MHSFFTGNLDPLKLFAEGVEDLQLSQQKIDG